MTQTPDFERNANAIAAEATKHHAAAPIHAIPLYRAIACKLDSLASMEEHATRWNWPAEHLANMRDKTRASLDYLLVNYLPHGSGLDNGVKLDDTSTAARLVFLLPFHCMDGNGYYCGWRDYTAVVTPVLTAEFKLRVSGQDWNDIKDYLHELMDCALSEGVDPYEYERKEIAAGREV